MEEEDVSRTAADLVSGTAVLLLGPSQDREVPEAHGALKDHGVLLILEVLDVGGRSTTRKENIRPDGHPRVLI